MVHPIPLCQKLIDQFKVRIVYFLIFSLRIFSKIVSDLDEPDIHPYHFRQGSFVRSNFRHDGSFDDHSLQQQSSIMSELPTQIPFIELYMSYYNAQKYLNQNKSVYQLCAMIIGSPIYKEILKEPQELFKLFLYTFDSSNTVGDLIKNLFDLSRFTETKSKSKLIELVFRKNSFFI